MTDDKDIRIYCSMCNASSRIVGLVAEEAQERYLKDGWRFSDERPRGLCPRCGEQWAAMTLEQQVKWREQNKDKS